MKMLKTILWISFCSLLPALIGCGGGGSSNLTPTPTPNPTPAPSSVIVSPGSATVALDAHQVFTATSNGAPAAVNWSVSVGNAPGTIDQSGNYTAPPAFPGPVSPILVTVTAALQSNPAITGTAKVTVVYPNDNHLAQTAPVKLGTTGGNSTDLVNNGKTISCCSGTLGSLVQRGGTFFIISNNHVLDKSDTGATNDPIGQPGLVDNQCKPGAVVANLTEHAALKPTTTSTTGACAGQPAPCGPAPSNVDAAIATIVSGEVDTTGAILDLGPALAGSIESAPPSSTLAVPANVLAANEGVAKSGRSSGLTCSTLQSVSTTVTVVYAASCGGPNAFTAEFTNQVIINGGTFSAAGDSGSLIVTSDTARPVGLLYGGNSSSTSANPIQDVLNAFAGPPAIVGGADHQVSCDPTASSPSTAPAPGASSASLSLPERQRVAAVQQRRAPSMMRDPAILGVEAGASEDSPGEGALVIHVSGATRTPIPALMDGVRTRIIASAQTGRAPAPVLSAGDMDQATAVKESHVDALMSQPGIQGVGVGRSNDNPAETAIVIYVLSGMERPVIPAVLDGLRTKIVEGDRFRAFGWGKETTPATKCAKK